MNAIYGNTQTWQDLYHDMFARWGELTGVQYVFEPNDDGADLHSSPGVENVRGDLRMSGKAIDGNGGMLAFNPFPQNGDMVIDTADSFFDALTGNSLGLRNVIAHEHGHGLGILHVCPITTTKLMEPFISIAFDTHQHDDIRAAHKLYGDAFEPDNFPAAATDLGPVDIGTVIDLGFPTLPLINNGSSLSLDSEDEQDWFKITIPAARRISIDLTPLGETYDSSPQQCPGAAANCCSGSPLDTLTLGNLGIQIFGPDMVSLVAFATAAGPGQVESLVEALLPAAGDYFIGVFETTTLQDVQLYTLSMEIFDSFLGMQISFPSGVPNTLEPGAPTTFNVQIRPRQESLLPASPTLNFRYDAGVFASVPLVSIGGTLYEATLPAPLCSSTPEFFISAEGATRGVVTAPAAGAVSPLTATVGMPIELASFSFEDASAWTVTNNLFLTDGAWETGVPVNCQRGDPPADFDGSGQCFLTDNSFAAQCNSDVDGGATFLVSPVFDIAGLIEARVTYARWYNNAIGAAPQTDTLVVQGSSDGGVTWTDIEVVGPSIVDANPEVSGGWVLRSFRIEDFVAATSQFQVRFIAQDTGGGSVVEAAIDAFSISGIQCADVLVPCPGDADGDGLVNFGDITSVLSNWLNDYTPGTGPGDANGDSQVNFADITEVLANWLAPCNG